jgi:hypothetical protein
MKSNIAQVGRSKQGVANGMDKHVGIGMPVQSHFVINFYSPKPQFSTFLQAMHVVSKTDS